MGEAEAQRIGPHAAYGAGGGWEGRGSEWTREPWAWGSLYDGSECLGGSAPKKEAVGEVMVASGARDQAAIGTGP